MQLPLSRPFITVILAMSLDGKIADRQRSPARFGSPVDKHHLETQIALADGVLFGAGTLRAYGTTLRISHPQLLEQRQAQNKPSQPVQIVCSASGTINPQLTFFRQPIPRWLLTTAIGAEHWIDQPGFERIILAENSSRLIDWTVALQTLASLDCDRLAVLGGGELVASLFAASYIDELWITVCPIILGGRTAPTPVAGDGFLEAIAPRLELIETRSVNHEVFLHYRVGG